VGIFLKPEELNEFYPSLKKLLTFDDCLLTLPRWAIPLIWIGNRVLLEKAGLSVEKIQKQGWTWDDFTKVKDRTEYSSIGNFSADGLLTQVVSQRSNLSPSMVLKILDSSNGPLPWKSDLEANMIHLFLSGKAPLLAGVRPIVYDFIRRKATTSHLGWEPVLLPPPSEQYDRINLPVKNGVIGIYRHHKSGGDDQLAAAARLALFLSINRQTHPWQRLKVVPATPSAAKQWAQYLEPNDNNRFLVNWLAKADLYSLMPCLDYQGKVYPGLKNYLMGKIGGDELEKIIVQNYFEEK
jgi:hypothetical protein